MKNQNAKNPAFEVPIDLPSVKPQDYSKDIASGNGSAASDNDPVHSKDRLSKPKQSTSIQTNPANDQPGE